MMTLIIRGLRTTVCFRASVMCACNVREGSGSSCGSRGGESDMIWTMKKQIAGELTRVRMPGPSNYHHAIPSTKNKDCSDIVRIATPKYRFTDVDPKQWIAILLALPRLYLQPQCSAHCHSIPSQDPQLKGNCIQILQSRSSPVYQRRLS
jgi:hypothetical protein